MEYSGIALLEHIKKDYIEDGTIIEVFIDDVWMAKHKLFEINYIDGELYWQPNTFKASMLYNDCYTFKEKTQIEKIKNLKIGDIHENFISLKKIASTLNEVIDKINEMEK